MHPLSEVFPKEQIVSTLPRQFENTPIELILCAGKSEKRYELMQLDQSNVRVVDYFTVLPSQKLLQDKLHQAIIIAQSKMNSQWTRTLSVYTSIPKA